VNVSLGRSCNKWAVARGVNGVSEDALVETKFGAAARI
jgi:hypothetical protein